MTTRYRSRLVVVMVISWFFFFVMLLVVGSDFKALHQLVLLLLVLVNRDETVHDQRVPLERVDRVDVRGARSERPVDAQYRVGIDFRHRCVYLQIGVDSCLNRAQLGLG